MKGIQAAYCLEHM